MNLTWDALPGLFPEAEGAARWLPELQRHASLLEAATARVRVSSVSPGEAVRRQYAESLELFRIAQAHAPDLTGFVDVGSGGGFPGMVLAIAYPRITAHLVEPLQKRAGLLREMAESLGLNNVAVHAVRAEEAGRGPLRDSGALVMARAVAGLSELLEYTAPLAVPGGLIALPKGSNFPDELAGAGEALAALKCEFVAFEAMREEVSNTLGVALVRKTAATPPAYPRRAGVPGKRPL